MTKVAAFAPAKINLALHVGPPRVDGRHELASLITFADIGDRVMLAPGEGLTITGPFAGELVAEKDNLVTRALALLPQARGVGILLEKNLPIASGIGGGSADAAAVLRAARLLFEIQSTDLELAALARPLGADVPACVSCRPALMSGTGEDTAPVELPALHAVLVNPRVPAPTGAVYRRYDERATFGDLALAPPAGDVIAALARLRNDLEPAACDLVPAIRRVLAALADTPGVQLARMSGSGATCFGLVADRQGAEAAAESLVRRHPGWWVQPARLDAIDAGARRVV